MAGFETLCEAGYDPRNAYFECCLLYTSIGKLSGGEKRRLYLLGVLAENANVLLFDEAGNNLEDVYKRQSWIFVLMNTRNWRFLLRKTRRSV